jgi:acetolactate synthase-1/2/3 large subunit
MQMNIQELALVHREGIPVKIVVLNNGCLGMIRQFQQQYFDSRFAATVDGYAAPDFTAVAQAYGIPSVRIGMDETKTLRASLEADGPALIEVMVPQDMPITPKLLIHKPIEEQDPPLDREIFRSLMLVEPWQVPTDDSEDLFRHAVVSAFERMKRQKTADKLAMLPIYDDGGILKGWLRPFTMDWQETLPGVGALLCRWRNENQTALSAAPFTATEESTARWLDQQVQEREDRLLFLITGPAGEPVGHIGLSSFDYANRFCEVDAVLRGEKQGHPGIMKLALYTMVDWAQKELKLQSIGLRVLHGNNRAIAFYLRNGFIAEAEQHDHEYLHMILAQTGGEP